MTTTTTQTDQTQDWRAALQPLQRGGVPALDARLGRYVAVLDDGFVRPVDYMGDEATVVRAARVSYGLGTKATRTDRGLLRYLVRRRHTTPLEHAELALHVRVPMDCWRQWVRHRTLNINEYSTRYSEAIDSAQRTAPDAWRLQDRTGNRQGSAAGEAVAPDAGGRELSDAEGALHAAARQAYERRLALGVAREQARKDLPLSTYTEAYVKCDLHNWLHFLGLRLAGDAQSEIRAYAEAIAGVVRDWVPAVWEAFEDFRLRAVTLSRQEADLARLLVAGRRADGLALAAEFGWLARDPASDRLARSGERADAEVALARLGLEAPWLQAA